MNLGSTFTLERPVDLDAVVPNFVGLTAAEARIKASELGIDLDITGEGTGAISGQNVASGGPVQGVSVIELAIKPKGNGADLGGASQSSGSGEKEISFSKPGITFGDTARNDALYAVFMRIAEAAEQGGQGGATFMQVQLKLTCGSSYVEELAVALEEAEIQYNLRDLP